MTVVTGTARRGRREAAIDRSLPPHRVALATDLRALRRDCGQPTYRTMGELAYCSFSALSEAASGKRFPSWETTRGYVTACLRHAGLARDLHAVLPGWRRAWESAARQEKDHRADPEPVPRTGLPDRLWPRFLDLVLGRRLFRLTGGS